MIAFRRPARLPYNETLGGADIPMATTKRDYYDVLSVGREASAENIRKAFRKLAFEYHPDRNRDPNAESRFKEISEAYEILSDSQKRSQYDQFGHTGASPSGRGFDGFDNFGFGDIFDAFFGGTRRGGRRTNASSRGGDMAATMTIEFDESAFGTEKKFDISRTEVCSRCDGKRAEPGSDIATCDACNGAGEIRRVQRSVFGQFVNVVTCDKCRGGGQFVTKPCAQCDGAGRARNRRKMAVKVPPGVDSGNRVRLTGEGEPGLNGGPPGDLFITINVKPHEFFERDDFDIVYGLHINVAQAALGDMVNVPTLGSQTALKIPAGTQSGQMFRIKGEGIQRLRGTGRGDELVTVNVIVPKSLNPEQKRMFEQLKASLGIPKPEHGKRFMDRIKDNFR